MAEVFDFNLTGGFSTPQQSYQEKLAADLKAATDRGEVVWENGQARSVNRSAIRPPSFSGSAGLAATGFVLPRAAPAFRDYLEAELRRQGYRDSPDGWIPPNASLTQADFDEGVRRIGVAYEREHAAPEREAVDTATSIVDWQSRRRQGAEEAQNIRGNTAEGPALPADTVVGRQRIQDAQGRPTNEFRTSVGVRRPEPDLSPRAVLSSVGRTPENARLVLSEAMRDYDAVNPRIPYVTPALETVRGFAGRALENAPGIRETSAIQRAIGLPVTSGQVARYGAESAVPTRGLDIALTAAPFAGKAVEGARALPGVGRALAGRAVEAGPAMRGVAEGVGPVFPARQPPASVAGRAVKGAGEVKPAAAPEMPTVRPGGRRVTASPAAVEPPVRPPAPPSEPPVSPVALAQKNITMTRGDLRTILESKGVKTEKMTTSKMVETFRRMELGASEASGASALRQTKLETLLADMGHPVGVKPRLPSGIEAPPARPNALAEAIKEARTEPAGIPRTRGTTALKTTAEARAATPAQIARMEAAASDPGAIAAAKLGRERPALGGTPPREPPPPGLGGEPPSMFPPDKGATQAEFWKPGTPLWKTVARNAGDVLTLIAGRTLQTGFDLSYPLRQAVTQFRRPQFWRAFDDMFKAIGSEDFAVQHNEQLKRLPFISKRTHISPLPGQGNYTEAEETLMSRLAGKIPGLKQTGRGVVVYINDFRANTVNDLGKALSRTGWDAEKQKTLDHFADYINRQTGRGNLGRYESSIGLLNEIFYSARRNVAMVQAPFYMFSSNPTVRMEAMKDFTAFFATGVGTLAAASLAGAEVGLDPTKADFGKIKVGNTRVDIWGGYQQMARMMYRVVDGQIKDPGSTDFIGPMLQFLRNKLSPIASLAVDVASGANTIGEKFGSAGEIGNLGKVGNEAYRRLMPLAWSGLIDAIVDDGIKGGILATSGLFGTGIQSYQTQADMDRDQIAKDVKAGTLPKTYRAADGTEQPLTDRKQMTPAQKAAFDAAHPDLTDARRERSNPTQKAIQEFKDETASRIAAIAPDLKTNPELWRAERSEQLDRQRNAIDGAVEVAKQAGDEYYLKPPTPVTRIDVLNQRYGKAIETATDAKGNVNWDKVDQVVAAWDAKDQKLWLDEKAAKPASAEERAYHAAVTVLKPYWDARDKDWQAIASANPSLGAYKTFDDYRQARIEALMAQGLSYTLASAQADKIIAPVIDAMSKLSLAYLAQHQDLVKVLDRFGYSVPSRLRGLTMAGTP